MILEREPRTRRCRGGCCPPCARGDGRLSWLFSWPFSASCAACVRGGRPCRGRRRRRGRGRACRGGRRRRRRRGRRCRAPVAVLDRRGDRERGVAQHRRPRARVPCAPWPGARSRERPGRRGRRGRDASPAPLRDRPCAPCPGDRAPCHRVRGTSGGRRSPRRLPTAWSSTRPSRRARRPGRPRRLVSVPESPGADGPSPSPCRRLSDPTYQSSCCTRTNRGPGPVALGAARACSLRGRHRRPARSPT
mmetsp:Transcript_4773/g.12327  ORF Transcript_4773/g.12327 Transcript_4773/m.12327 type:complete len:248 (+) Transcript_4773:635-1378(+)